MIKKAQAVTQAQQKVEVALQDKQEAETLKAIAQIKAERAELDKKAVISAAEAKAKEIEIAGGLSEKDKILATIKADRDAKVAAAHRQCEDSSVVIVGGEGKDSKGGLNENLMNLMLLRATGVLPNEPTKQP